MDTRTRVVDACWRLLEDPAATTVSLEAVASAAGLSRQAVYLHFGNRAALIVAAVEHAKEQLGLPALAAQLRDASSADDALALFLARHVELTPRTVRVSQRLAAERSRDPALDEAWQARDQSRRALVRGLVARFAEERRLAPGWTLDDAADLLWAFTAPAFTDDLMRTAGWSPDRLLAQLRRLLSTFLLPRPRRNR